MENKENLTSNNIQTDKVRECVTNLFFYSENGNSKKLKELIENNIYSTQTLNKAFRKLIFKFEFQNPEYEKCIHILMNLNIKINLQLPKENSTILMTILKKGDIYLIKTILEYSRTKEQDNEFETIDFNIKDKYNRNAIHYLFIYNFLESDVIEIFDYLLNNYCKNDKNLYENIISLLDTPDGEGDVPLGICLKKGWYVMTLKLIKFVKKRHENNKKNNLLHCAVLGPQNSIMCLKIILYYCKVDDLKSKNDDYLTPYQLAYKNGFYQLSKILKDYEKNFDNQIYKESFYEESKDYLKQNHNDLAIRTLNYFNKGLYEKCIVYLKNCQYYQYYNEPGYDDSKIDNSSLEWNYLLIRHKILLNSEKKNNNYFSNKKKKIKDLDSKKNKEYQNNNSFFPNQEEFKNFFDKNLYNFNIWNSNKDINNEEINDKLAKRYLLLYNKVVFYLKSGDFDSIFSTIYLYITNEFPNDEKKYYQWIIYVSSTLMLIEIFIYIDYNEIAEMFLESFDIFINTKKKDYFSLSYSENERKIFEYLNDNEIMNQFSKYWIEVLCYNNLLKMMINIKNSKNFSIQYKRLIKECQYINELNIFRRLKMLYICLKIQKNYYLNYQKCFKYLQLLQEKDMDIFYHNSLGIINLKLKNFFIAEFHFRQAISIYKNALTIKGKNFDFRINYVCSIEFNIALTYFYQGKYIEARDILLKLSKISLMKNNYKTWFRLGLCSKEIELSKHLNNSNKIINSSNINIIKGYTQEENNEIKTEKDCISIDFENDNENKDSKDEDSNDELYKDFLKDYKNNYESEEDTSFKKNNYSIKRIILRCTHNANNPFKTSIYLNESINSFKRVIFLSKKNLKKQESIKNLIEIYYNRIPKDKGDKEFPLNYKLRININILCETYLNLIFCFSLREEWNEIIITIKEFRKRNLIISEDIHIRIEQYEIEAYINLKYYDKAKNCIKNSLDKHKEMIQNLNLNYYSKRNNEFIKEIYYKINLFYGLALINIKFRNFKEAEANIMKIFNLFSKKNDLPNYFIDLIIYINLIKLGEPNIQKKDNIRFKNNILNMIKIRRTNIKKKINDY